jgi:hypothetical protein
VVERLLDAGVLALDEGDDERTCRLVACAQGIFEDTGSIPDPDDHVEGRRASAVERESPGRASRPGLSVCAGARKS